MNQSFDVGGVRVNFPVWVSGTISTRIDELEVANSSDGEITIPVFTDRDGAQTFLDNKGPAQDHYESILIEISDPLVFVGLLSVLQLQETSYVVFDPFRTDKFRFALAKVIADFADQITNINSLTD